MNIILALWVTKEPAKTVGMKLVMRAIPASFVQTNAELNIEWNMIENKRTSGYSVSFQS
jgi:hypothetical protein